MVKTAVSLPQDVFQTFDRLARQSGRSRSGVITEALEKYLHDLETIRILEGIEAAYADETPEEKEAERLFLEAMGRNAVRTLNENGDIWEPDR